MPVGVAASSHTPPSSAAELFPTPHSEHTSPVKANCTRLLTLKDGLYPTR